MPEVNSIESAGYIAFCIGWNSSCKLYKKRYERQKALYSIFRFARVGIQKTHAPDHAAQAQLIEGDKNE
jgi:hypothetical protein